MTVNQRYAEQKHDAEQRYMLEFVRQVCSEPDIAVAWSEREPHLKGAWESNGHEAPWGAVRILIKAACLPETIKLN